MTKQELQKLLEEIYNSYPEWKHHEIELLKIIKDLGAMKPEVHVDPQFKKELKRKLDLHIQMNKVHKNEIKKVKRSIHNRFVRYSLTAWITIIIVVPLIFWLAQDKVIELPTDGANMMKARNFVNEEAKLFKTQNIDNKEETTIEDINIFKTQPAGLDEDQYYDDTQGAQPLPELLKEDNETTSEVNVVNDLEQFIPEDEDMWMVWWFGGGIESEGMIYDESASYDFTTEEAAILESNVIEPRAAMTAMPIKYTYTYDGQLPKIESKMPIYFIKETPEIENTYSFDESNFPNDNIIRKTNYPIIDDIDTAILNGGINVPSTDEDENEDIETKELNISNPRIVYNKTYRYIDGESLLYLVPVLAFDIEWEDHPLEIYLIENF